jgi:hypothetical protein
VLAKLLRIQNITQGGGLKPNIISYSGGAGSAITAQLVAEKYGRENTVMLFADTLIESPDLYELNRTLPKKLGVELVTISKNKTPWQVFEDVRYQGNTRVDPCSRILKREFLTEWIRERYEPHECVVWVGIDCTEAHRLKQVSERYKPYIYRSILVENDVFLTREDKIKWYEDMDLPVPRLYKAGLSHNNCGGFCVKAGQAHFKKLYEVAPDVYLHHEAQQEALMQKVPSARPFLRKTINGKLEYLTLKEFREKHLETADMYDFGGCGCAF